MIRKTIAILCAGFGAAALVLPLAAFAASTVSIDSLSPGTTVAPGTPFSFMVEASGFTQPFFALSDSFGSSTIVSSNINSAGDFSWTPQGGDVGVHTIDVIVTDAQGHAGSASETVTVGSGSGPLNISVSSLPANPVVRAGEAINFSVSASGFANPTFSISDSFLNSTFSSIDIDPAGAVSWTPSDSDSGTHAFTILVKDAAGHAASTQATINVIPSGMPSATTRPAGSVSAATHSALATNQIQSIISLLQSFGADAATVQSIAADLGGSANLTAVSSGYVFSDFLGLGSTGQGVTALQQKLASLGFFSALPTGYFGSVTKAAVKAFQTAHGIDAVGYVGPGTRAALNAQ